MPGFFKALQARRIDRVAAVYVVAGWALVQAASIALPAFGAPPWSLRAFIALAIAGFPLALAIAWVAAPHPHTRKGQVSPAARHTDTAVLATLAFVLIAIAVQSVLLLLHPAPSMPGGNQVTPSISPGAVPNAMSIAVLPFTSMSGEPSNGYFSEGVSAELIGELSQIADLRVAARASSFSFQNGHADIATIARALKVRSVLDGSVRVEGSRVRIEAELSSNDGFTIWSQTYDGNLTHILDLQDEIARAITQALTHRLLDKGTLSAHRPAALDPEAYREYLQGRSLYAQRTDTAVGSAIALLKNVTRLQPDFADGFAALARAESTSAFNFGHREFVVPGEEAAQSAIRLDPSNREAIVAQALLSLFRWDWKSAAGDLDTLRLLKNSDSDSLNAQALLFKYLGFPEQSLAAAQASAQLNPLFPVAWANIASSMFELGRYNEASAAAANGLALLPGQPDIVVLQCGSLAHIGNIEAARKTAAALVRAGDVKHADGCLFEIALVSGATRDTEAIAERIARASEIGAARLRETVGQYFLLAGDTRTAMVWFEKAYGANDLGLLTVPFDRSTPVSLFADPSWKSLWQRPMLRQWRTAHDETAAELAKKPIVCH